MLCRYPGVTVVEAWMEWWGLDELTRAAFRMGLIPSVDQNDKVKTRWMDFGGNARRVLGNSKITLADLERQLGPDDALKLVRANEEGSLTTIRHRYVHAVVSAPYWLDSEQLCHSRLPFKTWVRLHIPWVAFGLCRRVQPQFGILSQNKHESDVDSMPRQLFACIAWFISISVIHFINHESCIRSCLCTGH
jgi:hypothetical protein